MNREQILDHGEDYNMRCRLCGKKLPDAAWGSDHCDECRGDRVTLSTEAYKSYLRDLRSDAGYDRRLRDGFKEILRSYA